jgi:hypothetical protein
VGEKLILSKLMQGQVTLVGELEFVAPGQAQLTTKTEGPAAESLRKAWAEVDAMKVIRMKWSQTDPQDKSGQTQLLMGRDVAKGEPDYPRAVADILSRQYGIFASAVDIE